MRAYHAALKKVTKPSPHNQDYVTKGTFRFLLIYLRFYYELWEDFEKLDVDGDRRVSEKEFLHKYEYLVNDWHIKIDNPKETFEGLLKKHHEVAHLTFTDFCDYVISERLKQHANNDDHDSC
jgi:hypothetical protein